MGMKLENRRDVMGRIDTDHSMVVAKIKTEKTEEGGEKRSQVKTKHGGNKKEKRRSANRIKKKEVWTEYESRYNKSMEIAKLIDKLDKRAERGEKTVEEAWQKVQKTARKLEIWMEEIAEEKGDLKYEYINKQIRSERDIAEKIERKTEARNQLKKCEDEEYKKILRKRYNN